MYLENTVSSILGGATNKLYAVDAHDNEAELRKRWY